MIFSVALVWFGLVFFGGMLEVCVFWLFVFYSCGFLGFCFCCFIFLTGSEDKPSVLVLESGVFRIDLQMALIRLEELTEFY